MQNLSRQNLRVNYGVHQAKRRVGEALSSTKQNLVDNRGIK